jgi:hypothetical protein
MLSIDMEEVFKPIDGLNGVYECSNYGRVRRVNKDSRCEKYKYLKLQHTKDGYVSVNPTTTYRKRVHRIVAELFIPNVENKPIVNHKDLNKHNNHVDNLEWVTHKENTAHANSNGKMGNIRYIVLDLETGIFYDSLKELSLVLNKNRAFIWNEVKNMTLSKRYIIVEKSHRSHYETSR